MSLPDTAWKILTASQWADWQALGIFHGAPVDLADGYIHLSAQDQLAGTLDKWFAGQSGLVLAKVDLADFAAAHPGALRWEAAREGALFPHCYAPLALAHVLAHGTVVRDGAGAVVLPG